VLWWTGGKDSGGPGKAPGPSGLPAAVPASHPACRQARAARQVLHASRRAGVSWPLARAAAKAPSARGRWAGTRAANTGRPPGPCARGRWPAGLWPARRRRGASMPPFHL